MSITTALQLRNALRAVKRNLGFPHGTRVALVAAGVYHTACVTALGEVFTWGYGKNGQLGHGLRTETTPRGDEMDQLAPRRVEALAEYRAVDVDCASSVTVVVTAAGELFAWGASLRCADSLLDPRGPTPARVTFPGGVRVRRASCGYLHTAAVDTEGTLYTWGAGEYNRLGHGNEQDVGAPRAVTALAGRRIAMVSCSPTHTAALTEGGILFTWGQNEQGQLGHEIVYPDDYETDEEPLTGQCTMVLSLFATQSWRIKPRFLHSRTKIVFLLP